MKCALVFWFTGLSGSGKSTVASGVKLLLEKKGLEVLVVDGDEVRSGHNRNLGFTEEDIKKNNEWIAEHCGQKRAAYDVILVPVISPYADSRQKAREFLGGGFYEVYFSADLECVMLRDTKGLYQKARNHEIKNLIGFSRSNPYQAPKNPDLVIATDKQTSAESVAVMTEFVLCRFSGFDRNTNFKREAS